MNPGRDWNPQRIDGVPNGVIVFDGVCVLCSGWVRFVIERDSAARFPLYSGAKRLRLGLGGAPRHLGRRPGNQRCGLC
jgi:hypothetical protein